MEFVIEGVLAEVVVEKGVTAHTDSDCTSLEHDTVNDSRLVAEIKAKNTEVEAICKGKKSEKDTVIP